MAKPTSPDFNRPSPNSRRLKTVVWVFTEGQTEKYYLSKLPKVESIKCTIKHVARSGLALVVAVINRIDKGLVPYQPGDKIWVVIDRDKQQQNPKNNRQQFKTALEKANGAAIEVAYSNDSFELWLLLHYQDVSREMTAKQLTKRLKDFIPEYKKADSDIYQKIERSDTSDQAAAGKRAQALIKKHNREGTEPADANPSTRLHQLIAELTKPVD